MVAFIFAVSRCCYSRAASATSYSKVTHIVIMIILIIVLFILAISTTFYENLSVHFLILSRGAMRSPSFPTCASLARVVPFSMTVSNRVFCRLSFVSLPWPMSLKPSFSSAFLTEGSCSSIICDSSSDQNFNGSTPNTSFMVFIFRASDLEQGPRFLVFFVEIFNFLCALALVGSHYQFIEVNPFLVFDRMRAYGMRLEILARTATRFEYPTDNSDQNSAAARGVETTEKELEEQATATTGEQNHATAIYPLQPLVLFGLSMASEEYLSVAAIAQSYPNLELLDLSAHVHKDISAPDQELAKFEEELGKRRPHRRPHRG
ncbi:hypothetical protein G4B88_009872 [Cannabis sativa]|uniref:Uncharacterized protein n=1 Tax=Cannabis sativa TaxID=3483 RepID=A0A7J6HH60_CANSA|nr:hypothetical protein G4B88_009872 [Cannabis sativa]